MLPDDPAKPKGGRPRADRRKAIAGIFWMLDNGAKWKDLPAPLVRERKTRAAKESLKFKEWITLNA